MEDKSKMEPILVFTLSRLVLPCTLEEVFDIREKVEGGTFRKCIFDQLDPLIILALSLISLKCFTIALRRASLTTDDIVFLLENYCNGREASAELLLYNMLHKKYGSTVKSKVGESTEIFEFIARYVKYDSMTKYGIDVIEGRSPLMYVIPERCMTRGLALFMIDKDERYCHDLLQHFFSDREICETAIQKEPSSILYVNPDIEGYIEMLKSSIIKDGSLLRHDMMKWVRYDMEIMMELIKIEPLLFKYASEEIRSRDDAITLAVSRNAKMLKFVPEAKQTKNIVIQAFGDNPTPQILALASEKLRNDAELISLVEPKSSLNSRYEYTLDGYKDKLSYYVHYDPDLENP